MGIITSISVVKDNVWTYSLKITDFILFIFKGYRPEAMWKTVIASLNQCQSIERFQWFAHAKLCKTKNPSWNVTNDLFCWLCPAGTNIIELWQPSKSFYRYPSYMKAGPLGKTCPRLTWPKGGHLHQLSFLIHLTTSHSQWPPSLAMTHAGSDEPAWSQLVLSRFSQQLLQAHFPEKHLTLPLPLTWLS